MAANPVSRDEFPAAETVFATAASRFYDELSEEDKKSFQRFDCPKDMLKSIQEHIKGLNSKGTSKLLTACKRISIFATAMEPFFKIIEIFISSHPDWAAITWGAIRLVFLLSSHFVSFFEKLAIMFERFFEALPNYAKQVDIIKKRIGKSAWRETHECLLKALSLVYVDILQFCHDACRIFSKKHLGVRYKAVVIWDLFWTPFDERFSGILTRMTRHQQDFDFSLKTVYSEEMLRHFSEMDRERQLNAQCRDSNEVERKISEKRVMDEKLDSQRRWIAAPNWTNLFDAAKAKRLSGTGLWLLQDPTYQQWCLGDFQQPMNERAYSKSILIISGKPGYGKTILSTRIVESLQQEARQKPDTSGLGYFYFDSQEVNKYSRITALQAIATQLLFTHRDNKTFIDIASFLMIDDGQGELQASERTLQSLIRLFIEQLQVTYLIFDGLDECVEWEDFLHSLRNCTENTRCKIAILARPHLSIPSVISGNPYQITLEPEANLTEIEKFLHPGIEALIKSGKLGPRYRLETIDTVVRQLSRRADSIFLWARLMLKHLESPTLTRNERADIIDNQRPFQGLQNLYINILQDIERRVSESQHNKVKNIFEWLLTSQRPWTTKMLETALAVQPDRSSTQDDFSDDFNTSILQLCGPMVEVQQGNVVRFIHSSVGEFLSAPPRRISEKSPLCVDFNNSHYSTAAVCLLYLWNEVPRGPLSGDAKMPLEASFAARKYPFLSYAAAFWSTHACKSLEMEFDEDDHVRKGFLPYLRRGWKNMLLLLSKIVADKSLVSMWIEASWTFGAPPTVLELPSQILRAADLVPRESISQLTELVETLKRLSKNLSDLNNSWGKILSTEPNEIWLPSINSLTNSEFWLGTEAGKVSWLPSDNEEGWVLVVSQVSETGKEVGVIKVLPSIGRSLHWVVRYQIWSLEPAELKITLGFEISPENILHDHRGGVNGFRFPVAISPSLRRVVIMGSVVHVPATQDGSLLGNDLFDPRCPRTMEDVQLLRNYDIPQYPLENENNQASPMFQSLPGRYEYHTWFRCCFSPCEQYITALKGIDPPRANSPHLTWVLDIYARPGTGPDSVFKLIARSGVWLNGESTHPLIFHPTKPMIAICLSKSTVLWRFEEKDPRFITIFPQPLDHMRFSNCGNFLHGVNIGLNMAREPVFLHLTPLVSLFPEQALSFGNGDTEFLAISRSGAVGPLDGTLTSRVSETQIVGIPEFSCSQGQLQISALNQSHSAGSVVLQTMRTDGKIICETVTRLPQSGTLEKSYAALVPTGEHKNIRLVLNMALQDSYSSIETPDFQLPAILDRTKDSIAMETYTAQGLLESTGAMRKRPIEPTESDASDTSLVRKQRR